MSSSYYGFSPQAYTDLALARIRFQCPVRSRSLLWGMPTFSKALNSQVSVASPWHLPQAGAAEEKKGSWNSVLVLPRGSLAFEGWMLSIYPAFVA